MANPPLPVRDIDRQLQALSGVNALCGLRDYSLYNYKISENGLLVKNSFLGKIWCILFRSKESVAIEYAFHILLHLERSLTAIIPERVADRDENFREDMRATSEKIARFYLNSNLYNLYKNREANDKVLLLQERIVTSLAEIPPAAVPNPPEPPVEPPEPPPPPEPPAPPPNPALIPNIYELKTREEFHTLLREFFSSKTSLAEGLFALLSDHECSFYYNAYSSQFSIEIGEPIKGNFSGYHFLLSDSIIGRMDQDTKTLIFEGESVKAHTRTFFGLFTSETFSIESIKYGVVHGKRKISLAILSDGCTKTKHFAPDRFKAILAELKKKILAPPTKPKNSSEVFEDEAPVLPPIMIPPVEEGPSNASAVPSEPVELAPIDEPHPPHPMDQFANMLRGVFKNEECVSCFVDYIVPRNYVTSFECTDEGYFTLRLSPEMVGNVQLPRNAHNTLSIADGAQVHLQQTITGRIEADSVFYDEGCMVGTKNIPLLPTLSIPLLKVDNSTFGVLKLTGRIPILGAWEKEFEITSMHNTLSHLIYP